MKRSQPLRARIAVTAAIAMLALAGLLVGLAELRDFWLRQRLLEAEARSTANLVEAVRSLEAAALTRLNRDIAGMAPVSAALGTPGEPGRAAAEEAIGQLVEPLTPAPAVMLLDPAGTLVAAVGMEERAAAHLIPALAPLIGGERRFETPALGVDGRLALLVGGEIRLGVRLIGHVVSVSDLGARIARFHQEEVATGVLAPDGGLKTMAGDAPILSRLHRGCCESEATAIPENLGGRRFLAIHAPLATPAGELVAEIVSLRDTTADHRRARRLTLITLVISAMTILLSLGLLLRSLRNALRPLGATVRLLRALAKGRTDIGLKPFRSAREIETLVQTVDTFREGLDAQKSLVALTEQLDSARRIQQALLPQDFALAPGLEIHGAMRPVQDVGGDFFDVFRLEDGRIAMIVADVSGKGIGAALFAALASTALRSNTRAFGDPVAVIRATNDELCLRNREELFISVFLALIDPASGDIAYVNAGHCPPLLARPGETPAVIASSEELVLGVMPGMDYTPGRLTLAPGETLLLYTDGFDEAQRPDEAQIGLDGAREIVREVPGDGPQALVEGVFTAIDRFADGAPQADDITLLALRRAPHGVRPDAPAAAPDPSGAPS